MRPPSTRPTTATAVIGGSVRSHHLLLTVVTCAALLLTACDAEEPTEPGATETDDAGGTEEAAEATEVDIVDNGFDPSEVEVSVGDTVQWTNVGNVGHTVTFDDGPDSGSLATDDRFDHTFEEAGEFAYICAIHPAMTGTVTVTD